MIVIYVDYDEFRPETYRGVFATVDGVEIKREFTASSEFEKDFSVLYKWAQSEDDIVMVSAMIDNYRTDCLMVQR